MSNPFHCNRRKFLAGFGAVGAVGLSGGAASGQSGLDIKIGEGTVPDYTHFYVADDLHLWARQSLRATSTMFPSGRIALDALVSNQVKIATCAETPVMFAAINSIPVRVFATVIKYEPFDLVAGPAINSVADVKGKRIGYAQGTNAHFYLASLLKRKGLAFGDISAVNLPVANFVPSLIGGAIDAFVWSEPLVSAALKQGTFKRLRSEGLYSAYGCVVAMQSTIDNEPDLLVRAVRSLQAADAIIKQQPDQAMTIMSSKLKLEKASVQEYWNDLHFGVGLDRPGMVQDLTRQAEWALANNLAKAETKMPNFENVVTDAIFNKV